MPSNRVLSLDNFTGDLYSLRQYNLHGGNEKEIQRMKRFLEKALHAHPTPRQRQCLTLYYFEGPTMTEIGRKLGISTSAVSRHIKRALRCLRARSIYY